MQNIIKACQEAIQETGYIQRNILHAYLWGRGLMPRSGNDGMLMQTVCNKLVEDCGWMQSKKGRFVIFELPNWKGGLNHG